MPKNFFLLLSSTLLLSGSSFAQEMSTPTATIQTSIISSVTLSSTVEWMTLMPTMGRVEYGPTPNMGHEVGTGRASRRHQATLKWDSSQNRLWYRINAVDSDGAVSYAGPYSLERISPRHSESRTAPAAVSTSSTRVSSVSEGMAVISGGEEGGISRGDIFRIFAPDGRRRADLKVTSVSAHEAKGSLYIPLSSRFRATHSQVQIGDSVRRIGHARKSMVGALGAVRLDGDAHGGGILLSHDFTGVWSIETLAGAYYVETRASLSFPGTGIGGETRELYYLFPTWITWNHRAQGDRYSPFVGAGISPCLYRDSASFVLTLANPSNSLFNHESSRKNFDLVPFIGGGLNFAWTPRTDVRLDLKFMHNSFANFAGGKKDALFLSMGVLSDFKVGY